MPGDIPVSLPIISIVTPSYNQSAYLNAAMESVISQAGDFLIDYIVVDGLSTDGSISHINAMEKRITASSTDWSERNGLRFYRFENCKNGGVSFRYIHEQDNGHGDALNKGFRLSVGDAMAWLNSDDSYHPRAFSTVIDIFERCSDVKWLVGKNTWWDKEGNCIGSSMVYKNIYDFLLYNYEWIQQESVFWRRSLWEASGERIDASKRYMVDGELWSRFFRKAELYHVDQKLSGYRITGENRAGRHHQEIVEEMRGICGELKDEIAPRLPYPLDYPVLTAEGGEWRVHRVLNDVIPLYRDRIEQFKAVSTRRRADAPNPPDLAHSLEYRIGFALLHPLQATKLILRKLWK